MAGSLFDRSPGFCNVDMKYFRRIESALDRLRIEYRNCDHGAIYFSIFVWSKPEISRIEIAFLDIPLSRLLSQVS